MSDSHSTIPVSADEVWRPIPGFEGWYSASNHGRIRRDLGAKGCRAGKILSPGKHNAGYSCVVLSKEGVHFSRLVHRLILSAFVGPCQEDSNTNHKDGDKRNNALSNLEYVTLSENQLHLIRALGKRAGQRPPSMWGEDHHNHKLTTDDVREIRRLYATGQYLQRELGAKFGVSQTAVGSIVRRKAWPHVD